MYLDTDITMAMIGLDDFLFDMLEPIKLENPKTSIITIFELQDVMKEAESDIDIEELYELIDSKDIELLPLTNDIMKTAFELLDKYEDLVILDEKHAIHAAHCIELKETMISTDTLYKKIGEIKYKDPRKYSTQDDLFLICEE